MEQNGIIKARLGVTETEFINTPRWLSQGRSFYQEATEPNLAIQNVEGL
ncbi:hypothetical protein NTGBS_750004 [Candidatus Nitrotoga sp. BS]|nr:hypothetical protein NTGBS_750004 [Candidatus Nitrotoga sp. BS]